MTTKIVTQPNKQLWLAAIKLPMYTVAVIPITVGTALAFYQTTSFYADRFLTFLGAAILIIAWLNLSNDVFDSDTGIDKNKAHSVVNLTGNKNLVFWVSNLFLLGGILAIVALVWWQQDLTVLEIVLVCCALGYTYQGPPFRFGYEGLGEIICFICFGPLAISAAYYAQTGSFSLATLPVGLIIGITTSIILFCSHFHQVEDDLAAGKRSPIVRLGTATGAVVLTWLTGGVFVLTTVFVITGVFGLWSLLIWSSLPIALKLVNHVREYHDQPDRVKNSKFIAVNFHFQSGLLLALGFVLSTKIL